jgi:hypothetical protein
MAKALICINSCNRIEEIKKYIWDYLNFCNYNTKFDFILALDGNNNEYISFCDKYSIPLIYSDEREGVGISKNRVLKQFPEYDYYFFIEDDIELIDASIFQYFIDLHNATGYHHFCNNHIKSLVFKENVQSLNANLTHSMSGGAQFAFYSKIGIEKVGGWHTTFSKYKRFGHTEHSYRFVHTEMQKYPFIFDLELYSNSFLVHNPPAVTQSNFETNVNELIEEEQELIDHKSTFFPIQTISNLHYNGASLGFNKKVDLFLRQNRKKYPLTQGKKRRASIGEYYALKLYSNSSFIKKSYFFICSLVYFPLNNPLKHFIKERFKRK